MASQRRQNHSCDQCRKSKRRCLLVEDGADTNKLCTSCRDNRRICTFDFVNSQCIPRKRGRRSSASQTETPPHLSSIVSAHRSLLSPPEEIDTTFLLGDAGINGEVGGSEFDFGAEEMAHFDFDMFFNNDLSMLDLIPDPAPMERPVVSSEPVDSPQVDFEQRSEKQTSYDFARSHTEVTLPVSALGQLSPKSPVHLLTSTFEQSVMNTAVARTSESVFNTLVSRFLHSTANAFADSRSYSLYTRSLRPTPPNESDAAAVKLTPLGACRFLDNFGPLFGNHRSRHAQDDERKALKGVIKAFASQFASAGRLSTVSNGSEPSLFEETWRTAYSQLLDNKSDCSFTGVYTVLLFDLIVIPLRMKADPSTVRHAIDLLDHALGQLQTLEDLVNEYTIHLSDTSLYHPLIHSSLKVIKWFGYVRDTLASILTTTRSCVMPDVGSEVVSMPRSSTETDQDRLNNMCRHGAASLFDLYRRVITLRQSTKTGTDRSHESLVHKTTDVLTMIGQFSTDYDRQVLQFVDNFLDLPTATKRALVFLLLFLNFGVLHFVGVVRSLPRALQSRLGLDERANQLQAVAIAAFGVVTDLISKAETEGDLELPEGSGVRLALIAHHANHNMVAAALQKAIEHTIDANMATPTHDGLINVLQSGPAWMDLVKALLRCLVALQSTQCGLSASRSAIQSLVAGEHADIIMECWTPE